MKFSVKNHAISSLWTCKIILVFYIISSHTTYNNWKTQIHSHTHTHRTTKTSQHTNWMATNKFNINMIVLFRFMFTRKQFNKHNINKYLPYLNVIILSPTIKQKQNKKQNTKEAKEKNISMFWLIFWQIFGTIHVCVCVYYIKICLHVWLSVWWCEFMFIYIWEHTVKIPLIYHTSYERRHVKCFCSIL